MANNIIPVPSVPPALQAEVRQMLAWHLGIPEERIAMDDDIVDRYGPDSLEMLDICLSFNENYDIQIEASHLADAVTPGDFCRLIMRLLEEKAVEETENAATSNASGATRVINATTVMNSAEHPMSACRIPLPSVTDDIFVSRVSKVRIVKD